MSINSRIRRADLRVSPIGCLIVAALIISVLLVMWAS